MTRRARFSMGVLVASFLVGVSCLPGYAARVASDDELARMIGGGGVVAGPCMACTWAMQPAKCSGVGETNDVNVPVRDGCNPADISYYDSYWRTALPYNCCLQQNQLADCTQVSKNCARWYGKMGGGDNDLGTVVALNGEGCTKSDGNGCNP